MVTTAVNNPSIRWLAGFGALWVGLTIIQEAGAGDFAAMLAILIASSVLIIEGPKALAEVDRIVG